MAKGGKGGLFAFIVTAAFSIWRALGDASTAKDVFDNWGPVMSVVGSIVLSSYFGPLLSVGCLLTYVWLAFGREWLAEHHGTTDLTLLGGIAPPSARERTRLTKEAVVSPESPKATILKPVSSDAIVGAVSFGAESSTLLTVPVADTLPSRSHPNPRIKVTVGAGTRVRVSVHNTGDPFKLRAILKVISTSAGHLDQSEPHVFLARQVGGGEDVSQYDVAHLDATWNVVTVWGEGPTVLEKWDVKPGRSVKFSLGMIFQHEIGNRAELTFRRLDAVRIEVSATSQGLSATLLPWTEV